MLRLISTNGDLLTLNVNDVEYLEDELPQCILTQSELEQVRTIKSDALPDYQIKVAEEVTDEQN